MVGGTRRRERFCYPVAVLSPLPRGGGRSVLPRSRPRTAATTPQTFLLFSSSLFARVQQHEQRVACPPRAREERARRRRRRRPRRQATRTMRDATPGVTPPPRSDATATRYAPCTQVLREGPETRFRSRSRRSVYRAGIKALSAAVESRLVERCRITPRSLVEIFLRLFHRVKR